MILKNITKNSILYQKYLFYFCKKWFSVFYISNCLAWHLSNFEAQDLPLKVLVSWHYNYMCTKWDKAPWNIQKKVDMTKSRYGFPCIKLHKITIISREIIRVPCFRRTLYAKFTKLWVCQIYKIMKMNTYLCQNTSRCCNILDYVNTPNMSTVALLFGTNNDFFRWKKYFFSLMLKHSMLELNEPQITIFES